MRYGESTFDILYLLFAIISGCMILKNAKNRCEMRMGLAALVLGAGDAFHLVPRVLNYFVGADLSAALGIGKFVTSVTMTVFYVLLYYVWIDYYRRDEKPAFRLMWICILLSFLFYIPVAVAAGIVPMLGMLMLPKTVCYILMICAFLKACRQKK